MTRTRRDIVTTNKKKKVKSVERVAASFAWMVKGYRDLQGMTIAKTSNRWKVVDGDHLHPGNDVDPYITIPQKELSIVQKSGEILENI